MHYFKQEDDMFLGVNTIICYTILTCACTQSHFIKLVFILDSLIAFLTSAPPFPPSPIDITLPYRGRIPPSPIKVVLVASSALIRLVNRTYVEL